MGDVMRFWAALGLACGLAGLVQPVRAADPLPADSASPAAPILPALTPVRIEIAGRVGSRISKPGDLFPIRLAVPILRDGVVQVPAGAEGMGEVVHAKRSGMSGSAGELILAARYIVVDGRQLRLRSLHLAAAGKDATRAIDGFAVAAAASPVPVSVLGLFVTGGETVVPAGTIASARTAEDFRLAPPVPVTLDHPQQGPSKP
jgi:hypothetical protein